MSKLYHRFLMGNILVFIDINIFIDILPDFIGYLLMISALGNLYAETQVIAFKKSKYAFILVFLISIVGLIMNINTTIVGGHQIMMPYVIAVSSLFLMLGYFYFYEATIAFTSGATKESVVWFQRASVILYTINIVIYSLSHIIVLDNSDVFLTLNILVQIIFYIAMLFHFRNLRRYFENKENQRDMNRHVSFNMEV